MSSLATIRRIDATDKARVKAAAERFCNRHGIAFDEYFDAESSIDHEIYSAHPSDQARLRRMWMSCYCRALRVPYDVRTRVAWGYVGTLCE